MINELKDLSHETFISPSGKQLKDVIYCFFVNGGHAEFEVEDHSYDDLKGDLTHMAVFERAEGDSFKKNSRSFGNSGLQTFIFL